MGTSAENNENAPIAFVLVVCAGLSTCIGAAFVFNTRLVKLASKRFLAGSLGIAAGVILYVSLVEIFVKSQGAFVAHGYSEADAYTYATVSLFGGILFYKGVDYVVNLLEGDVGGHIDIDLYDIDGSSSGRRPRRNVAAKGEAFVEGGTVAIAPNGVADNECSASDKALAHTGTNGGGDGQQQVYDAHHRPQSSRELPHDHNVVVELSTGPIIRPSPDLQTLRLSLAGKVHQQHQHPETPVSALTPECKVDTGNDVNVVEEGVGDTVEAEATMRADEAVDKGEGQKLVRMGLLTAVAIGIHNFPEGLATFVGALSNPSVGVALAVAIAIHNIPEGLCVAIPVYYATGNRWKAFGWGLLSGISEPIGAAFGWLILKDIMSELVYGLLFGLVAGMMVNITVHELIPTAVRYDPADKVTTNSIFAGMAIMALSLILFKY